MKYLLAMLRSSDIESSLEFCCDVPGLAGLRRIDDQKRRFTPIFPAAPGDADTRNESTYHRNRETCGEGRNFGHVACRADDLRAVRERLQRKGVTINRPPRDGYMAFVRSPDNISIELLQKAAALPPKETWVSMPDTGHR